MDWYRLWHTLRMHSIFSAFKRAKYLQKHHIFKHVGENCMVMFRKIPLHAHLISFQDNVRVASNVSFITHDVIYSMLNAKLGTDIYREYKDCIDIRENVFIGANTTVLPGVRIGPNTIIGACTLVNKDVGGGVWAGNPVRFICSIEEFLNKREKYVAERNAFLQDDSDKELWEWFTLTRSNRQSSSHYGE